MIKTNPISEWILIDEITSLDFGQISHSCCTLMRELTEIQFMDLIIKIYPLTGFCLSVYRRLIISTSNYY